MPVHYTNITCILYINKNNVNDNRKEKHQKTMYRKMAID